MLTLTKHNQGISWLCPQIIDSILDYSKLEASGEFPSPLASEG